MSTEATEWCVSCDERRPLDALLEVINVRSGDTFAVCRPEMGRSCFRSAVGPAHTYRIRSFQEVARVADSSPKTAHLHNKNTILGSRFPPISSTILVSTLGPEPAGACDTPIVADSQGVHVADSAKSGADNGRF